MLDFTNDTVVAKCKTEACYRPFFPRKQARRSENTTYLWPMRSYYCMSSINMTYL